jgi:PPM family protein phosphatase
MACDREETHMLNYHASGSTDVGLKRSNNEDAYLIQSRTGIFAVADGMGGAAAGEVASSIFTQAAGELFGDAVPGSAEEASALVQETFRLANERMISHVAAHPDHCGMGCTAELLVFSGERYVLGHVGDSRTYLLRDGELRQITKDHSLVQQQVDQGLISPAEARKHSMKNVVLRALGADLELTFDLVRGSAYPQDLFLLCSDGLTDMLDDESIRKGLASRLNLAEKVDVLIEGAKSAGGRDNITVVLCQLER